MNSGGVVIVGGCGHVGLPLGLMLADSGLKTVAYDIDTEVVARVQKGIVPFEEPGAQVVLDRVLSNGLFTATSESAVVGEAEVVIVVIGTPVDEHLNPDPQAITDVVDQLAGEIRDGQLLVLRSTVYPGVTRLVAEALDARGLEVDVAFCPERIAEGRALTETRELPQIVAGVTPSATSRANTLFARLTDDIVELDPEEAELAKLFTNTWRYIKFAAANQLFMIANDFDLDFERIRRAVVHRYPRAADMPGAGFAAGPCLLKDTMQLAAFNSNNFTLGHAAMTINEGLPLYLVARMEKRFDLKNMTVGLLGMAFKGGSDDTRSSLSYKLRKILRFRACSVVCTDPYVRTDPTLLPLEDVLSQSDVLVIATPHTEYSTLAPVQPVVDVWGLLGHGVRI